MLSLLPQLPCFINFWHHLFCFKFGKTSNKILFHHQLKTLEINMANLLVPNSNASTNEKTFGPIQAQLGNFWQWKYLRISLIPLEFTVNLERNFGAHPLFVAMVSGHFFFASHGRFLEMTCNSFHSLCVLICWCYAWFVPYAWTLMRTKSRLDIENQIIYDVIMSHCVFF
jgi:hypothetical protein